MNFQDRVAVEEETKEATDGAVTLAASSSSPPTLIPSTPNPT